MANKEYELAIKIAGLIDSSLNESCNMTKKQLRSVAKEASSATRESVNFSSAMQAAGPGINSLWNGAEKAVKTTAEALMIAGAAAGVVGGMAVHAGSDFESAFAGVRKTVEATDQQLGDLEEGLRDMAMNMPMTAVELSSIAEAAGQLGIHTENIEDFTKTMADLSVATNLSTEEGASELAKFANITGMSQDKFQNLGSTIVDLGNNMATTEADIVAMGMRLAGAGHQVGMTEADIMGFAAALSSVGIEAEAGGSAMSKLMVNMQLAVETGAEAWKPLEEALARTGHTVEQAEAAVADGGNALKNFAAAAGMNAKQLKASVKQAQESAGGLQDFADVADMSAEEFAAAFKDNAAKAIGEFVAGLNDTERMGQSAIVTLDAMGISEVRLRDALLRATNASELFGDSIELANTAFEENTALTKEAEQRYATFESKVDMVKNRITDMGISLYQDFRDPLSDCLDIALQFTEDTELFDTDFIVGMAESFQKNIPTVLRNVREAKEAMTEFAGPLFAVGDWMLENPDIIAGTLTGIGTAIVSLKLAQIITSVTTAIKALHIAMASNPITAAIGIAALAGGAIVGLATKIKISNEEMKRQSLNEHFGDISLSIGELQEAAKQILGEKTIQELGYAMDELSKVSDIAGKISDSSSSLRKLTWKIGMGMELGDADQARFEQSVNDLVENSIGLVEQAQYTAHLNVKALFGEESEIGNELIAGFDSMYSGIQEQVSELGRQLGDAYNSAMEDGIIDTDEAEMIQELQAQLGRITEQVSQAQLDAKLERIKLTYSGKELDEETFKNLQQEIQDQVTDASSAANQAYEYNLGALEIRLDRSRSGEIDPADAAYLTQEMYDDLKLELDKQLLEKQIDIDLKGLQFQTQSITDAYSDEIAGIVPEMGEKLSNALAETINYIDWSGNAVNGWTYDQVAQWLDLDGLDKTTKKAIEELWEKMEPQFLNMVSMKEQYEEAGREVPKYIADGISDAASIGIIAGSESALWAALGNTAEGNTELQNALSSMEQSGTYIPDAVAAGITGNIENAKEAANKLCNEAEEVIQDRFRNMTIYGEVSFNMLASKVTTRQSSTSNPHGVVGHATGGIFDKEHLAWISEQDKPEAVVPLDGSFNAVSIWKEAGERLGMISAPAAGTGTSSADDTGGDSQIVYSPVFQIGPGTSEEMVRKANNDAYEKFEKFMNQYQRTKKRLAF